MNELVRNWRVSKGPFMSHHKIEGNSEIEKKLRNTRRAKKKQIHH